MNRLEAAAEKEKEADWEYVEEQWGGEKERKKAKSEDDSEVTEDIRKNLAARQALGSKCGAATGGSRLELDDSRFSFGLQPPGRLQSCCSQRKECKSLPILLEVPCLSCLSYNPVSGLLQLTL